MNAYNIEDLIIATYMTENISWKNGRALRTISANKGVLYQVSEGCYLDLISNISLNESSILGYKPFIATGELLSREQIIYIFTALESLKFDDMENEIMQFELTPLEMASEILSNIKGKVKKIDSNFRK